MRYLKRVIANDPMTFILFLSFLLTVIIFTPFFRFDYFFSFVLFLLVRFLSCTVRLCRAMYDYVWLCMAMYDYV